MTRKQQMAAAAGESEPLRVSNQQLRASLAAAQDSLRQLTDRFNEEKQGREAAVAAKEHAEKLLLEAQKEATHWQVCVGCVCLLWEVGVGVLSRLTQCVGAPGAPWIQPATCLCATIILLLSPANCCVDVTSVSCPVTPSPHPPAPLCPCLSLPASVPQQQNEHSHQKKIMETQRDLLEQQQAVLRKLAAQKHTAPPATPAASAATAPAPAAAAAPAAPAASAAPADATAAAAPPSAQPNNA